MIRVVTLSNKPKYLPDAIASLEAQTRKDFVHELKLDEGIDWGGKYPPSVWYNEVISRSDPEDYICWLSDDDVLYPNYIEVLAGFLDKNPEVMCCYGGGFNYILVDGKKLPFRAFPSNVVYDKTRYPACLIDGGQTMTRKKAFDLAIGYPYSIEEGEVRISDGVKMNKLAGMFGIYPATADYIVELRTTELSAHCQIVNGSFVQSDWKRLH